MVRLEQPAVLCTKSHRWGGHGGPPLQKLPHLRESPSRFVGVALRGHPNRPPILTRDMDGQPSCLTEGCFFRGRRVGRFLVVTGVAEFFARNVQESAEIALSELSSPAKRQ